MSKTTFKTTHVVAFGYTYIRYDGLPGDTTGHEIFSSDKKAAEWFCEINKSKTYKRYDDQPCPVRWARLTTEYQRTEELKSFGERDE